MMAATKPEVIVAGHICLDVIPTIEQGKSLPQLMIPGKLTEVGGATVATGGAVANTGIALHRLGIPASLMGKVGDDTFGQVILDLLSDIAPSLAEEMIIASGEQSSYSIVVSIPGIDRIFLHCPGTNDTFQVDDLDFSRIKRAGLFHFGYPPLMKQMYQQGGAHLVSMFKQVKEHGVITSLDMAMPDEQAESGKADWPAILQAALPYVDIFLPSLDEIMYMFQRDYAGRWMNHSPDDVSQIEVIEELAERLLAMGCGMVGLKMGESGLYLRTSAADRLRQLENRFHIDIAAWANRQLWVPCYQARVVGTTGAGDCTIAGFLAGLIHGLKPETALNCAVAVGAASVEAADATSGVVPWEEVMKRVIAKGNRLSPRPYPRHWIWYDQGEVWAGPRDSLLF